LGVRTTPLRHMISGQAEKIDPVSDLVNFSDLVRLTI
jgi:hypothetical protein